MAELSPAARAVLDASTEVYWDWGGVPKVAHTIAAAALRVAADQVVPPALEEEFFDRNQALPLTKMVQIRRHLYAIATELEGQ